MTQYYVESGPLQVKVSAEDAFEAAIEAVRWWQDARPDARADARGDYLCKLSEEIYVRPHSPRWRSCEKLLTIQVIAFINQEPVETAWEKLLEDLSSPN